LANPSVPLRLADEKSRIQYFKFETLEKQWWSYLRKIKVAKTIFHKRFAHNLTIFIIGKIWVNIGIFLFLKG
jgi:hypothetical protein